MKRSHVHLFTGALSLLAIGSHAQSDTWTLRSGHVIDQDFGFEQTFTIDGTGYVLRPEPAYAHSTLWAYDPDLDQWTQRSAFPRPRILAAGFAVGGKGYIACGLDSTNATNELWEYDPLANAWSRKADIPVTPRSFPIGFSLGAKGYLYGGTAVGGGVGIDLHEYDPLTDTWTPRANQVDVERFAFAIGSKAYMLGFGGTLHAYDPGTDSWSERTTLPHPVAYFIRNNTFTFKAAGRGFAGGYTLNGNEYDHDLYEYSPSADAWIRRSDIPEYDSTRSSFDLSIDGYGYVGLNNDHMWRYQPTPGLVSSVAQTYYCAGTQIVFTGQVLGDFFGPDNVFSIQLSDASGDFAAPQTIGTSTLTAPGAMFGVIPANTPPGSGYRVRIVSDHPVMVGPANDADIIVVAPPVYYHDLDGDGFGDPADQTSSCDGPPEGYVADATDDCPTLFGLVGSTCDDGRADTDDDRITPECQCHGVHHLVLSLTTDDHGEETTWEVVKQGTNNVVVSGQWWGYPNNQSFQLPVYLRGEECFQLRVHDAGGNGITGGGYRLQYSDGSPVIDNDGNGAFGSLSTIAGDQGFCTPQGSDGLNTESCDRGEWVIDDVIRAHPDPAVSSQFGIGNQADDGYQFWFFDPNGTYTRRVFRDHATSGGNGEANALRATKLRLSSIVSNPLPYDVLLNVRVRSKVNGVYAPFGPACRFTLVHAAQCPLTKLEDDGNNPHFSCGVWKNIQGSDKVWAKVVTRTMPGGGVQAANKYQFEWTNGGIGYTRTITSNTPALILSVWNTNPLIRCEWYDVRVRASFDNGATWCPYGGSCPVFILGNNCGAFRNMSGLSEAEGDEGMLLVYPDPGTGERISARLPATADGEVFDMIVHDLTGRAVQARHISPVQGASTVEVVFDQRLPAGNYLLELRSQERRLVGRFAVE